MDQSMKFEIKHRFSDAVLFSLECGSLKLCVEAAVKAGANLTGANLAGAYLARANLAGANLAGALKPATPEESVAALDKVREIILDAEDRLDMGVWHKKDGWQERTCAEEAVCGTTHCLAGWLQVCSTNPDVRKLQPHIAGYICAPVAAKMFYTSNKVALKWLRERAYAREAK